VANDTESLKLLIEAVNQSQAVMAKALADLDKFDTGSRKAGESAKTMAGHTTTAHSAIHKLGEIAREVAGPLIALFTIEKVIEFTKGALEAAEAMSRLGEMTGLSLKQMNSYALAASSANVSQGELSASLNIFSRNMAQLNDKQSDISRLFKRIGIEARDAHDNIRPMPELLDLFREKMVTYGASADRAAAMTETMGRSGNRMINVFQAYKTETSEATSFTKAHLEAAEHLSTIMAQAKMIFQVFVMDALTPLIGKTGSLIDEDGKLTVAGTELKIVLDGTLGTIKDLVEWTVAIVKGFTDFASWVDTLTTKLTAMTKPLKELILDEKTGLYRMATAAERAAIPHGASGSWEEDKEVKKAFQSQAAANAAVNRAVTAKASAKAAEEESKLTNLMPRDTLKDSEEKMKKFEEDRQEAEEAYKAAILKTQDAEEHGWLSRDEAALKNIAEAKVLEAKLKEIIEDMAVLEIDRPDDADTMGLGAKMKAMQTQQQAAGMKAGAAEPGDIMKGLRDFSNGLDGLKNKTKLVADTINGVLGPAIDGISKGIYGMITGTMTWGQAFTQAGAQILQSLIKIGVEMAVQYVLGLILGEAAATTSATEASALAGAWGTAATAASIATLGGAAAFGALAIASMAAGSAAGIALAMGSAAFDEGGYTGRGGRLEPAGIVHKGEVVIPADTVSALGPMHFAHYFGGRLPGYDVGGFVGSSPAMPAMSMPGGGGGGSNVNVHVAQVNTRQDFRQFQARDGWKVVLDQLTKRSNVFKA